MMASYTQCNHPDERQYIGPTGRPKCTDCNAESSRSYRRRNPAGEDAEFDHFEDKGCEVAPKCVECPLPFCRFDDPEGFQILRQQVRDLEKVAVMMRDGLTVLAAAGRFHITERTMFRVLHRIHEWFPGHIAGLERGRHNGKRCGCAAVLAVPALRRGEGAG